MAAETKRKIEAAGIADIAITVGYGLFAIQLGFDQRLLYSYQTEYSGSLAIAPAKSGSALSKPERKLRTAREASAQIAEVADRAEHMAREMRNFSRGAGGATGSTSLSSLHATGTRSRLTDGRSDR